MQGRFALTSEMTLRVAIGLVFVGVVWMVTRYRRRAQGGERFDLEKEGWRIAVPLRAAGLLLWLYLPLYVLLPRWMAWSTFGVPSAIRWGALAIAAILVPPFVHWAQRSLGTNVTTTVVTRQHHQLVTHGPYAYIRHPLYTGAIVFFLGMSIAAGSWFLPLVMLIVFPVLMMRIPKEEAELEDRFGEAYRRYKARTGRFLPRIGSFSGKVAADA